MFRGPRGSSHVKLERLRRGNFLVGARCPRVECFRMCYSFCTANEPPRASLHQEFWYLQ